MQIRYGGFLGYLFSGKHQAYEER